ncbi:peptidase inhibitor family I36 protein [Micromonospora sp. NPDC049679]|uniref:peptidase inhibitor family I36 protein n=1 Tax=Micromonospora sp. NPDC049679 TaxID=3155920 RepID=UPI0033FBD340
MLKKALTLSVRTLGLAAAAVAITATAAAPAHAAKPAPAPKPAVVKAEAPAPAADGGVSTLAAPSGCTSGNLCFWVYPNYVDGPGRLSGSNPSWFAFSRNNCPNGTWADCAESLYNNGVNCTAHVYKWENYGYPRLSLGRGVGITNLASRSTGDGDTWANNIRSNNWC